MTIGFDYDDEALKIRDYLNKNSQLVIDNQVRIIDFLDNLILESKAKSTVINTKLKYKLLLLEIESNLVLYVASCWQHDFKENQKELESNSINILNKIANVKYNEFFRLNWNRWFRWLIIMM